MKLVTFRLGQDLFAADILSVERVLRYVAPGCRSRRAGVDRGRDRASRQGHSGRRPAAARRAGRRVDHAGDAHSRAQHDRRLGRDDRRHGASRSRRSRDQRHAAAAAVSRTRRAVRPRHREGRRAARRRARRRSRADERRPHRVRPRHGRQRRRCCVADRDDRRACSRGCRALDARLERPTAPARSSTALKARHRRAVQDRRAADRRAARPFARTSCKLVEKWKGVETRQRSASRRAASSPARSPRCTPTTSARRRSSRRAGARSPPAITPARRRR